MNNAAVSIASSSIAVLLVVAALWVSKPAPQACQVPESRSERDALQLPSPIPLHRRGSSGSREALSDMRNAGEPDLQGI